MGSGDLKTDLSLEILTPTPSVRAVEGHMPHQDAEGKARRRSRPEPEGRDSDDSDDEGETSEDHPRHRLDHLA